MRCGKSVTIMIVVLALQLALYEQSWAQLNQEGGTGSSQGIFTPKLPDSDKNDNEKQTGATIYSEYSDVALSLKGVNLFDVIVKGISDGVNTVIRWVVGSEEKRRPSGVARSSEDSLREDKIVATRDDDRLPAEAPPRLESTASANASSRPDSALQSAPLSLGAQSIVSPDVLGFSAVANRTPIPQKEPENRIQSVPALSNALGLNHVIIPMPRSATESDGILDGVASDGVPQRKDSDARIESEKVAVAELSPTAVDSTPSNEAEREVALEPRRDVESEREPPIINSRDNPSPTPIVRVPMNVVTAPIITQYSPRRGVYKTPGITTDPTLTRSGIILDREYIAPKMTSSPTIVKPENLEAYQDDVTVEFSPPSDDGTEGRSATTRRINDEGGSEETARREDSTFLRDRVVIDESERRFEEEVYPESESERRVFDSERDRELLEALSDVDRVTNQCQPRSHSQRLRIKDERRILLPIDADRIEGTYLLANRIGLDHYVIVSQKERRGGMSLFVFDHLNRKATQYYFASAVSLSVDDERLIVASRRRIHLFKSVGGRIARDMMLEGRRLDDSIPVLSMALSSADIIRSVADIEGVPSDAEVSSLYFNPRLDVEGDIVINLFKRGRNSSISTIQLMAHIGERDDLQIDTIADDRRNFSVESNDLFPVISMPSQYEFVEGRLVREISGENIAVERHDGMLVSQSNDLIACECGDREIISGHDSRDYVIYLCSNDRPSINVIPKRREAPEIGMVIRRRIDDGAALRERATPTTLIASGGLIAAERELEREIVIGGRVLTDDPDVILDPSGPLCSIRVSDENGSRYDTPRADNSCVVVFVVPQEVRDVIRYVATVDVGDRRIKGVFDRSLSRVEVGQARQISVDERTIKVVASDDLDGLMIDSNLLPESLTDQGSVAIVADVEASESGSAALGYSITGGCSLEGDIQASMNLFLMLIFTTVPLWALVPTRVINYNRRRRQRARA